MTHGGPLHPVRTKAELARHIGEEHVTDAGTRVVRTVWPPLPERRRWTREELERSHAEMHEPDTTG